MKIKFILLLISLILFKIPLWASGDNSEEPFSGKALRISQKPKIDGVQDALIWTEKNRFFKGNFTQTEPNNGEKSAQETEIYLAYDDFAIYVFAKMYDHPDSILSEFGPRDEWERNTDQFAIALDTYNNKQNAFLFTVTSAGVQLDTYITATDEDDNWNAVWKSSVKKIEDGWTAEFEIPYSALRFPKEEIQTWGLNFMRQVQRKQEQSFWNPVDASVEGFVNQFGTLTELKNIQPPVRLSFTPYVSSYLVRNDENETAFNANGGMDLKLGLNEGFTLDMSLIPDFGQVRSDNVVLNLSPFEVQFDENRPFFTEGTELFNKGGLFYSRRVGKVFGEAELADNEEVESQDNIAQLLNATKISGRNKQGLGIGFFNAVTKETYATIKNIETDERRNVRLDARSNFNVLVIDQNLKNNSNISLINTNVTRFGGNDANVTGVNMRFNDKKNMWNFSAFGAISQVKERIDKGEYDNDVGFKYNWSFGKQSGTHQFNFGQNVESHNYNPNDLGFLQNANEVTSFGEYQYGIFKPKGNILRMEYTFLIQHEMLQKPLIYTGLRFKSNLWVRFKNFWNASWYLNLEPFTKWDYFSPREEGRYFTRFPSFVSEIEFETDERKAFKVEGQVGFWTRPSMQQFDDWLEIQPRYRVNDRLSFEHSLSFVRVRKERDYVTTTYLDEAETELDNIIYGMRDRNQVTNVFTGIYNFNELMNLSFRLRHYWSNVQYAKYYDLQENGRLKTNNFEEYDEDTNEPAYNRNFNAFNIDLVYTWQFAPGSQMSIVWKNSIYKDETLTDFTFYDNLTRTLKSPQTNSLSIRILYFLDYLDFKKSIGKKRK